MASLLLARSLKLPEFYWAPISTIVILLSTINPLTLAWQRFAPGRGHLLSAVEGSVRATPLRFLGNFDDVAFRVAHLEIVSALTVLLDLSDIHAAGDQDLARLLELRCVQHGTEFVSGCV